MLHYEITSSSTSYGLPPVAASYYTYLISSLMSNCLPALRDLYVRDASFPEVLLLAPPPRLFGGGENGPQVPAGGLSQPLNVYSKGLDELEWNFTPYEPSQTHSRRDSTRPVSFHDAQLSRSWGGDARKSVLVGNGFGGFLAVPVEEDHNDNMLDGLNGEEPSEVEVAAETNRRNEMPSSIATANPKYSDFLILCGEHIFPAHKAIICSQSDFFAKVFDSHFSEACTGRIRLPDHPLVVLLLLDYLYTSDYTFYLDYDFPSSFLAEGQTPPGDLVDRLHCCELSVHIHMFLIADRLLISGLKNLAKQKFADILRKASFPTVYPRAVREVYTMTSIHHQLLRDVIVDFTLDALHSHGERGHFDPNFPRHILEEFPEFAQDLTAKLVDEWVEDEKSMASDLMQIAEYFRLC
ncbi:hypothetical protein CFD26_105157 [Aspergillus turcosus]|uniref:BTB domain-containing protein n=1 Tax=Aspergillus turcosus TaxID=1245748 RepID=A0A421D644_9EURO|nr:hypothetical protein CFD26_105157 [Aspergillus turcosus]